MSNIFPRGNGEVLEMAPDLGEWQQCSQGRGCVANCKITHNMRIIKKSEIQQESSLVMIVAIALFRVVLAMSTYRICQSLSPILHCSWRLGIMCFQRGKYMKKAARPQ